VRREPVPRRRAAQNASTAILNLRGANGQTQPAFKGPAPQINRPKTNEWSLFLGEFPTPQDAQSHLARMIGGVNIGNREVIARNNKFQARLRGLSHRDANTLCEDLLQKQQTCLMIQLTGT